MRISIRMYRAVKVPIEYLREAAGSSQGSSQAAEMQAALLEKYGPMSPTLKLFWPSVKGQDLPADDEAEVLVHGSMGNVVVVGLDVMGFELPEAKVPMAGIVSSDPLDEKEIWMVDGALRAEMGRMGIMVEPKDFEWRFWYEVRGQ